MTSATTPAKPKNANLPFDETQKTGQAFKKMRVLVYPDSCSGKTGHTSNNNIPRIASPKSKKHEGGFASALVHEVRSPLSSINLSANIISDVLEKDHELQMYVDIIMRNSMKINDLVTEFLKYQHSDETAEERYSITEILDEVLAIVGDRIRLKNITVIKNFLARDIKMNLNKPKMKIALSNIINNAIDAMASSKGILKLTVKSKNGKYSVKIEDNGCGISKDKLPSIFKAGFTDKPEGSGFGLSIANDFLQSNHVGTRALSKEGKGTSFILLFNENTMS